MPDFIKVSDIVKIHNGLEICKADSSGVKVLQWQCQGVFTPDPENGVVLRESGFLNKARSFIDKAKSENVDLLLTPEYSFPYEALEEIISSEDRWPNYGKLWCLCTQGTSNSNFEKILDNWGRMPNVIVEKAAFNPPKFRSKKFVNPLIYLFKLDNGDLFILPQFKTGAMRDPEYQFEADGMSCGQVVYIFDLCGNCPSQNRFMSVICSDILYFDAHNIGSVIKNNDLILFHPQLNAKPRHERFVAFRNAMFQTRTNNGDKILTLNWAEESKSVNGSIIIKKPWSAFYKKYADDYGNEKFRKKRNENFQKGTPFARNEYVEIWFSHRHEHCKLFYINKDDVGNSDPLTKKEEPTTKACYVFDNSGFQWDTDVRPCRNSLGSFIHEEDERYTLPLSHCGFNGRGCSHNSCELDKSDYFFACCFGKNEWDEIVTDSDETVVRMIAGSDEESDRKRKQKADKFETFITLLKQNKFPDALKFLDKNHKFELSKNFPRFDDAYNIVIARPSSPEDKYLKVFAAIIPDESDENEIKRIVKHMQDRMDENLRGEVLVYYKPYGKTEFTFFDKHFDTSILHPQYADDFASMGKKSAGYPGIRSI